MNDEALFYSNNPGCGLPALRQYYAVGGPQAAQQTGLAAVNWGQALRMALILAGVGLVTVGFTGPGFRSKKGRSQAFRAMLYMGVVGAAGSTVSQMIWPGTC